MRRPQTIHNSFILYANYNVLINVCSKNAVFYMFSGNPAKPENCSAEICLQTAAGVCEKIEDVPVVNLMRTPTRNTFNCW